MKEKKESDDSRKDQCGIYGGEVSTEHPGMVWSDIWEKKIDKCWQSEKKRNKCSVFFSFDEQENASETKQEGEEEPVEKEKNEE